MKIVPLGGETLGVRSFSVFVETDDLKITIDPGLSVVAIKNGFPPTPFEIKALNEVKNNILSACKKSDIIIITHYHFDHFFMDEEVYKGKIVYIKDPDKLISNNQKKRAQNLLSIFEKSSVKYEIAYGEKIFKNTKILFSPIFPHGIDEKMGGVISVLIINDERFLYTSDVLGFSLKDIKDYVIKIYPSIIFFDGSTEDLISLSILNLNELVDKLNVKIWLMEHHPYRTIDYKEKYKEIFGIFEKRGINLYNFAKFLKKDEMLLEGERKIFYENPERVNRKLW